MKVRFTHLGGALAISLALSASAFASPIVGFGDPLTAGALVGGTQQGFDGVADGLYSTLTLGNVTYTGVDAPFTIGPDFNGQFNTTGGKSLFNDFDLVPHMLRFDFANPVGAFAFNWGASDNTWVLNAYDAGNNLLGSYSIAATHASNSGEYFGLALAGIKYATLTDQLDSIRDGDYVFVDRFTTNGASAAVPEPTTMLLMGSGLAVVARRLRARKA